MGEEHIQEAAFRDGEAGPLCPHLGVPWDRETRATFPLRAHSCWRAGSPEPIPPPYQAAICLAAGHPGCPRYRDAAAPPPWEARP